MNLQTVGVVNHEAIIVGGGLTGLRAAITLLDAKRDVALLSKVHPLRSQSGAAQGGINATFGNAAGSVDDSWERHAFDTVKGSDYLADQDAVDLLCAGAPHAVFELEHMGAVFSRTSDGRIAQRPFGGAGYPRTCYAADRTGRSLLQTLYKQAVERGLKVYQGFFVVALVVDQGRCVGCVALDVASGSLHGFSSPSILLATGGYGRVFSRSTNAVINTGDGAALALRAGCTLEDMEFVQFHPTTLAGTNILITEAARGEGGTLLNRRGERFMRDYAPKAMELAPRDIVARAIQTEINEGRAFEEGTVHLDLTHLGADRIEQRLPGIRTTAMRFAGVDPIEGPIPVQPGQHYSMGGVACDRDGKTTLDGLFAAGECACVSVHGANRLGGNSLLETIVFGRRAGIAVGKWLRSAAPASDGEIICALHQEADRLDRLMHRSSGESIPEARDDLRGALFSRFGVFREGSQMAAGVRDVEAIQARINELFIGNQSAIVTHALVDALELENMIAVAQPIARGAALRAESRGAHFRTDHPKRNDKRFLCHSLVALSEGRWEIDYEPVTLGRFEVKERTY